MSYQRWITALILVIVVLAAAASGAGVFLDHGPGPAEHRSVHGQEVMLHGRGPYRHMSAEVAVQGVAQDYVTLFVALPLLVVGLALARNGSVSARLFLAGITAYVFVTYLFYLTMGAYNALFLVYAALLGLSFFTLFLLLYGITASELQHLYIERKPLRLAGGFLVLNGLAIALMWLGVVVPPLLDGSIYPVELQHYTTLIVQGLDLGLLLPLSVVIGVLLWKRTPIGLLLGPVYLVFLSILMLALIAKIVAIGLAGGVIMPPIVIIPPITVVAAYCSARLLRSTPEAL